MYTVWCWMNWDTTYILQTGNNVSSQNVLFSDNFVFHQHNLLAYVNSKSFTLQTGNILAACQCHETKPNYNGNYTQCTAKWVIWGQGWYTTITTDLILRLNSATNALLVILAVSHAKRLILYLALKQCCKIISGMLVDQTIHTEYNCDFAVTFSWQVVLKLSVWQPLMLELRGNKSKNCRWASMPLHVQGKMVGSREGSITHLALERLVTSVFAVVAG